MQSITLEEFLADPARYLTRAADAEDLEITRDGVPWVILTTAGVRPEDEAYMQSQEFWDMIHERQQGPHLSWEEAKAQDGW